MLVRIKRKKELSYTVGGNVNFSPIREHSVQIPLKIKK
jgi:hypothetical protein